MILGLNLNILKPKLFIKVGISRNKWSKSIAYVILHKCEEKFYGLCSKSLMLRLACFAGSFYRGIC